MIDPTSRYANCTSLTCTTPDGRDITYLSRRILPISPARADDQELVTTEGDRLDLVAARLYGDPLAAWRIADANEAMSPAELVAEPGRRLRLPRGT